MFRERVTDPLAVEDLWDDLRRNLAHLKALGIAEVFLLFGFSWGRFIYGEGQTWSELAVAIDEVEPMIARAYDNGHGALGHDNLYITIPDFDARLQYSHEIDIHLSYTETNAFVQAVLNRWAQNQWFMEKQPR